MNELVYLFELDSVNRSPNDVIVAHKAILNEIVNKGNIVVLSMNQLTDSKAISDMLMDENKYQYLLELFRSGSLLVSLYNDIRTPSQYIQRAIDRCLANNNDTFIFSNLPIRSNDYALLKIVKNALRYSDLSLLTELVKSKCSNNETNGSDLDFIKRFINLILEISKNDYGRNPPKKNNTRTFSEFMDSIVNHYKSNPAKCISADVFQLLNDIKDTINNEKNEPQSSHIEFVKTDDSIEKIIDLCYVHPFNCKINPAVNVHIATIKYLHDIQNKLIDNPKEHRSKWIDLVPKENCNKNYIEKIINLIYNYTVEDSILNVKKSYLESNFEESFFADFERRLTNQLKGADYTSVCELSEKDWKVAVRISKLKHNKSEFYLPFFISNKRLEWVMFIFEKTIQYILIVMFYVLLFLGIEIILSSFEEFFCKLLGIYFTSEFIIKLVSIFVFGIIGTIISICLPDKENNDMFTCVKNFSFCIHDLIVVIGGKYEYRN